MGRFRRGPGNDDMRWSQLASVHRIGVVLGGAIIGLGLLLMRDCLVPPGDRFLRDGSAFVLAPAALAIGVLFLLLGLTPAEASTRRHGGDPLATAVAWGATLLAVGVAGWLWAVKDESENGLLGALLAIGAGVPGVVLVGAGGAVLAWRRMRRPRNADKEAAQPRPPLPDE